MRLQIYTTKHAADVRPDDIVDCDAGPLLVDEVQLRGLGAPAEVTLLGRRVGAEANTRRIAVHCDRHDEMRVLPRDTKAMLVWSELVAGIQLAIDSWHHTDAEIVAVEQATVTPWAVEDGIVLVRKGGLVYQVNAEPDPEPEPDGSDEGT